MFNENEGTPTCSNCSHSCVCNIKNAFKALKTATDDLGTLPENRTFDIIVSCRCYQKDTGNVR